MPHIHLQTTANVLENDSVGDILESLVRRLAEFATIDPASIKAYHTLRQTWRMGEGGADGFIHCEVAIVTGRSVSLRRQMGDEMTAILRQAFKSSIEQRKARTTVEVREMERDTYVK